jgi:hypothetical protein
MFQRHLIGEDSFGCMCGCHGKLMNKMVQEKSMYNI